MEGANYISELLSIQNVSFLKGWGQKMKIKLFTIVALTFLILSGCSAKSAKQQGEGISIEMSESLNIGHITLMKYVDGIEVFSESVIYADNSSFKKGDIIWFDVSPSSPNSTVELAVTYSENVIGSSNKTTPKIEISPADEWVNLKFSSNYQLNLIEMD